MAVERVEGEGKAACVDSMMMSSEHENDKGLEEATRAVGSISAPHIYYLLGGQISQTLILVFLAPKSESRNVHESHTGDLPPTSFQVLLVGCEG
jgi:hypothetical protein